LKQSKNGENLERRKKEKGGQEREIDEQGESECEGTSSFVFNL